MWILQSMGSEKEKGLDLNEWKEMSGNDGTLFCTMRSYIFVTVCSSCSCVDQKEDSGRLYASESEIASWVSWMSWVSRTWMNSVVAMRGGSWGLLACWYERWKKWMVTRWSVFIGINKWFSAMVTPCEMLVERERERERNRITWSCICSLVM